MSVIGVDLARFIKSKLSKDAYLEILDAFSTTSCWQASWTYWFCFLAGLGTHSLSQRTNTWFIDYGITEYALSWPKLQREL